jgi:uncharacterized protein (DUF1499 family)
MKLLLTFVVVALCAVIIYFFVLGYLSKQSHPLGLVDAKLAACIQKPNCVCSEYPEDVSHFIAPIELSIADVRSNLSSDDLIAIIKDAINEAGGQVIDNNESQSNSLYVAATFKSSLFGFTDDVEARFDPKTNQLHFRSASRVGHSDFGVNRKRVERLMDVIMRRLR